MLTGCVGRNGGGLNHYVGQEKLAPMASWLPVAMALDWVQAAAPAKLALVPLRALRPVALRRATSASCRRCRDARSPAWRRATPWTCSARAVRWAGCRSSRSSTAARWNWCARPRPPGATHARRDQGSGSSSSCKAAISSSPWRIPTRRKTGRAYGSSGAATRCMSSAKGHEYFLKHYLGTHTNAIADEVTRHDGHGAGRQARSGGRYQLPHGHLGAVFRHRAADRHLVREERPELDRPALVHPPAGRRSCRRAGNRAATGTSSKPSPSRSAIWRRAYFPDPVRDVVAVPLQHDTPAEMAQPEIKDWAAGECEPIPGKTMPNFVVVERDYANLYNRFVSLGPDIRQDGIGVHGITWQVADLYDELVADAARSSMERHALPLAGRRERRRRRDPATWRRRPTARAPIAPSRPRRRRLACRWPIWRKARAAFASRSTT